MRMGELGKGSLMRVGVVKLSREILTFQVGPESFNPSGKLSLIMCENEVYVLFMFIFQ